MSDLSLCREHAEDTTGGNTTIGAALLARSEAVVAAYRARLSAHDSVLATDDIWPECAAQANLIVADCATTLDTGRPRVPDATLAGVQQMAQTRVRRGIRPHHSVRAGAFLFETVMAETETLLVETGADLRLLGSVAGTLAEAIMVRLETGARGYDSYLLEKVQAVTEADRLRLARDIHDRVGSSISVAMRYVELSSLKAGGDPVLDQATEALADTVRELSDLITRLRGELAEGSLRGALNAFVESLQIDVPQVVVEVNGIQAWASTEILDQTYLIVRECVRNAVSHARATRVRVHIDIAPHEITASVEDDGTGFEPAVVTRGHGLRSIAERVELIEGKVTTRPRPAGGTAVSLWVPLGTATL